MKSQLYTRTGDDGSTSLVYGQRVAKNCDRIEAYGTIDELSSHLGVVTSDPACPPEVKECLQNVQNELFNVGCYLATAVEEGTTPECKSLTEEKLTAMEKGIDELDEMTPKMKAFILPGGTALAAQAHVARTVCRRAERRILALASKEYVDYAVIRYVNRLSDYLFIASRFINHKAGVEEITWRQ